MPADEAVASALSQWVVFACGEHRFGLPLERTREILPPRTFTRLPGCGPEVLGLVGIRGRVLTVFDFGIVAGVRSSMLAADHRLLVLIVRGKRVAVIVDEIIAVSRDETGIVPFGEDASTPASVAVEHIVGVGRFADQPFLALDPELILGRLLT